MILCLCLHKKRAPKNNEINSNVKRPLWEQRKVFGDRKEIVWEGQLVYPIICYATSLIAPWSLVLNKPVHPEALYQFITKALKSSMEPIVMWWKNIGRIKMSIEFGNSVSEAYLGSTTEFSYHPDSHCSKPSWLKIKKRETLSKHTPQSANHKLKTLMLL